MFRDSKMPRGKMKFFLIFQIIELKVVEKLKIPCYNTLC